MSLFGADVEILTAQERALRAELRKRVVIGAFALGVLWGLYYYFSETAAGKEFCRQAGQPFPCAGMQKGIVLAPFTFWLFTVPLGWVLSFPLVDYLRRGQGAEKPGLAREDED